MKGYNTIEIAFKIGHSAVWEADKGEWDDYAYDGKESGGLGGHLQYGQRD